MFLLEELKRSEVVVLEALLLLAPRNCFVDRKIGADWLPVCIEVVTLVVKTATLSVIDHVDYSV